MKTLTLITENIKGIETNSEYRRIKNVIEDSENRPEYIEIDITKNSGSKTILPLLEPVIRMNFSDNHNWKGSMNDLKNDIKLAKLAKQLVKAVQNGDDFDGLVLNMSNLM